MNKFFSHKKALIETKKIGEGSHIWAFTHILPKAIIGTNANIGDHCFIENDVVIGNNVTIKCGVYLWDGIRLYDDVFIGPAAVFTNDLYPRSKNLDYTQRKTVVKKGASIGANVTMLAGVTIGSYALAGAGAVVTKDIPDFALVYGNPAQIHGYVCVCTKKIDVTKAVFTCSCKRVFYTKKGKVSLEHGD